MKTHCRDCCYPIIDSATACGCCEGITTLTPLSRVNRPGLSQLSYRIGKHSSFLQSMLARLSHSDFPALSGLTTRDPTDPSIALLDSWSSVADVLTFYQERIANEGYLRTATERHSILELAKLVGYQLRPGVSASVFLAYTLEENSPQETIIPPGTRAQSIPGPDEFPQTFETSEELKARAKWNNLKPRLSQPQTAKSIENSKIYLQGITTNLKPNDPLLVRIGNTTPVFRRIKQVILDAVADRTLIILQLLTSGGLPSATSSTAAVNSFAKSSENQQVQLIKALTRPASLQPANSLRLNRQLAEQFKVKGDSGYRAVSSFTPQLREILSTAAANLQLVADNSIQVYALRKKVSLFGNNVLKRTRIRKDGGIDIIGDWPVIESIPVNDINVERIEHENENQIFLDAQYDDIQPNEWIVIETQDTRLTDVGRLVIRAAAVDVGTRSEYGITAPTTAISLKQQWITLTGMDPTRIPQDDDFNALRSTRVYAQAEALSLSEEPIELAVCGGSDDELLELDGFYEGLESGRWVVVSGEREIAGTQGVRFSELAMLSAVTHDVIYAETGTPTQGEKNHTFIKLAEKLEYCFKRNTVTIYGNVVKANHGETRKEILGSGDGSKALQSFELKQKPLTYTSAANPSGVESSIKVLVNEIEWHQTETLAGLPATERNFISVTDNENKTSIVFGNGETGARLPTGIENIRAEYRNGIGKGGNVKAEQISLLASKPLGVKQVINPLRSSGGADRENREQARKSAPLAVMALDRLVSVRDYQDFARLYAGIGKSIAIEISDGQRQIVHVTIAGADDIPIDKNSDLFLNLRRALIDFGDPHQPIQLDIRELKFIVINANVKIKDDYQWSTVAKLIRAGLLETFGFENRELGQDVTLSEVMSSMHAVEGVQYVDIDTFGGIPEKIFESGERRLLAPDEIAESVVCLATQWSQPDMPSWCADADNVQSPECVQFATCQKFGKVANQKNPLQRLTVNLAGLENQVMRPAQLAFLTPEVPETLILNQIK